MAVAQAWGSTSPVDARLASGVVRYAPMVDEGTGDRVRRHRRFRGMTQQALAEAAGTDKAYISRLEAGGIGDPGIDVLERIAAALQVQLRSLADPRWYKEDPETPAWESQLMADDRLDETAKQALMRIIRPLLSESSDEEGRQAG